MDDISILQKDCFKSGKIVTAITGNEGDNTLSLKCKYLHMLCGTMQEDRLSNILFTYRCPYCDHNIFKHKRKDNSIVENTLNDLYLLKNYEYDNSIDQDMKDLMQVLDGWIRSIEEIKDLEGTAWLLENNKYVKQIQEWKSKIIK